MRTPAKSLAWLTDLHLDAAPSWARRKFYKCLEASPAALFLITGDISNARLLPLHLREIAAAAGERPVYFCLGNHDFYGSSFARVDGIVAGICSNHRHLHHLDGKRLIDLGHDTVLIGHRGWCDGRTGWGEKSLAKNPDFLAIEDFKRMNRSRAFQFLRALGLQSASRLRSVLPYGLTCYNRVIVATHFPPALQAARFRGKPVDWLRQPFFCNSAVGQMLFRMSQQFPRQEILVLCGHTHSAVSAPITPNLTIRSGVARQGFPALGEIISLAHQKEPIP
jgi:3',5'-cyclic-AMP phosphodiesterase